MVDGFTVLPYSFITKGKISSNNSYQHLSTRYCLLRSCRRDENMSNYASLVSSPQLTRPPPTLLSSKTSVDSLLHRISFTIFWTSFPSSNLSTLPYLPFLKVRSSYHTRFRNTLLCKTLGTDQRISPTSHLILVWILVSYIYK